MKTIEELYEYAKQEKIKITDFNFCGDPNWKGHCIYNNANDCMIFLNNKISKTCKKCTLAHEIGHFKTGIMQNNLLSTYYKDVLIRSINDFRANKWAIKQLIPIDIFISYIGSNKSKFDIAQELEVTEELIELACHVYEGDLYKNKII